MNKTQSFADFIKSQKAQAVPSRPTPSTRPAVYESRIVILKRRSDGSVEERNAAPSFLRQDAKALVSRINLPPDYFWRGSPEHLARKAEMEKGA